ncbi:MAG: radical SAM protein [Treponema sp.]|nr:radical SAM protein [Treponema sp.]
MNKSLAICSSILIETSPQSLPLGAACIASALKANSKTKNILCVELNDISKEDSDFQNAEKISFEKSVEILKQKLLKNQKPDFFLASIYVWNRKEFEALSICIKKEFPSCVTICGGPEVTANPFSFEKSFDYITTGPGEEIVPDLISKILEGRTEGLTNIIKANPQENEILNLNSPYLDGTLDPAKYGGALWELARGCPFKCSYCFESKGENKISYFPMERIKKELDLFAEKKIPQVFVLDPTYNADKKRAIEILNLIAKKTPNTFYYFEARAEFIDRELARAFTKIPCALQFGLQSADEDVLRLVHRGFNKKVFVKNVGILNQEGVIFGFDLIYGLPGDTFKGFKQSMDFALNLYPNNLETFCLSVLPGTVLFDEAEKLNLHYESEAPYHVLYTDKYSKEDLKFSSELSLSCTLFYNIGRSVPWFISFVRFFNDRPHKFLQKFIKWYEKVYKDSILTCRFCSDDDYFEVQKMQLAFLKDLCHEKHCDNVFKVLEDIVILNGAFSVNSSTGKSQKVQLKYHPDDLLSEYVLDPLFFVKNAKPYRCSVLVQNGDYRLVKN